MLFKKFNKLFHYQLIRRWPESSELPTSKGKRAVMGLFLSRFPGATIILYVNLRNFSFAKQEQTAISHKFLAIAQSIYINT